MFWFYINSFSSTWLSRLDSTEVNYYAPLEDSDDDTVATVPNTASESDTDDSSDEERTIVTSNCSQHYSATEGAGEGVLKSQSRVTHNPGLSHLVSSSTNAQWS